MPTIGERIADRDREVGTPRQLGARRVKPLAERGQQRFGSGLALASSLVGRSTPQVLLDRVEAGNGVERRAGGRRSGRAVDIEELAPDMRPAGDLGDALTIKPIEPGIAVGVKIASGSGEVRGRALALAVGRIAKQQTGGASLPSAEKACRAERA